MHNGQFAAQLRFSMITHGLHQGDVDGNSNLFPLLVRSSNECPAVSARELACFGPGHRYVEQNIQWILDCCDGSVWVLVDNLKHPLAGKQTGGGSEEHLSYTR